MERITFNRSLSTAVLHEWAKEFNRAHREAPICASMWRLRFAAAVTFVTLVFLAGRALAETNADAPTEKPDAIISHLGPKGAYESNLASCLGARVVRLRDATCPDWLHRRDKDSRRRRPEFCAHLLQATR
jgi:hypothetical protein